MEFCNRKQITTRSIQRLTKIILHRISSVVWSAEFPTRNLDSNQNDEESRRLPLSVKRSSNGRVHLVSRFTILRIDLLVPQLAEESVVFWVAFAFKYSNSNPRITIWNRIQLFLIYNRKSSQSLSQSGRVSKRIWHISRKRTEIFIQLRTLLPGRYSCN